MISREEAIRLLDPATTLEELTKIDYYAGFYGNEAMKKALNEAFTLAIEALSHERPKGRWVCLEAEIGYYACSECDHRILRTKCNYCPNCGADMAELPNCGADMRDGEEECLQGL